MHWAARLALALIVSVPSLVRAQTPAVGDAPDQVLEAEQLAARAFEAYGKKEYTAAIELYEEAYEAAPNADALYNIARIYDLGLRDSALAIAAYQRFLREPTATPERSQRARERSTELKKAAPAALASPASAANRVSAPSAAGPAPAESIGAQAPSAWSELRVAALVSAAAGVTSVGIGFGMGLTVLSDADIANASCVHNVCSTQRGVDAAKSAATHATLATAGVSIGAALIVTGAALWLLDERHSPEHEAPSRLRVLPVADASTLGMELGGAW